MKAKKIVSIVCFTLSCILLAAFLGAFALFLVKTSATALSFAEAAKNFLLLMVNLAYAVAWLAFAVACAGVSIKLSQSERMRKYAKRLFVAEMLLFFVTAGVIATMYVIV